MIPLQKSRFWLAGACAFLLASKLAVPSARAAAYHPTSQELQDVAKLFTDFQTLKAGSDVTDAEKSALAADLALLTTSTTKPSQTSIDQLAADLAGAFADGSLSPAEKAQLVLDVDGVFNSAGLTTAEANQFIADATAILVSSGIDAADVQLIAADLAAVSADAQTDFISTDKTFTLTAPAGATDTLAQTQLTSTVGDDGAVKVHLSLETLGLITGTYTVNATNAANGAPVALGPLKVVGLKGKAGAGAVVFGDGSSNAFPTGFDPATITTVTVTDASGAVALTGSAVDAAKFVRVGNFGLVAGTAYPDVVGHVAFDTKLKKSKDKSHFLLYARKLPADTTVNILINGTAVGQATSDVKGRLLIIRGTVIIPVKGDGVTPLSTPTDLPDGVDLSLLDTLELTDAQGQVIATAGLK